MRTGAIFARGSCRALKRLALVGVVLVLGGGAAFAQAALTVDDTKGTAGNGIVALISPSEGNRPEGRDVTVRVNLYARMSAATPAAAIVVNVVLAATGDAVIGADSPQMATFAKHSGTSNNPEFRTATVTFRIVTRTDAGADDDEIVFTVTPGSPFAAADAVTVKLDDLDTQRYTLTRTPATDAAKVVAAGELTLSFKSTRPLEGATMYRVTSSDSRLGTVNPAGGFTAETAAAGTAAHAIVLSVPETATRGDSTQLQVWRTEVGQPDEFAVSVTVTVGAVLGGTTTTTPPTTGTLTFAHAVADPMPPANAPMTLQLPPVTNGTGTITYAATGLPQGLMFTPATRMISGMPTTPGATTVTYTATDSATPTRATGRLTFTITVAPAGTPAPPTTTSKRTLKSVTVGPLREGGQAQATVTLSGPVETGRIFKAKLRLVGQLHTRQNNIANRLTSPPPYRVVGGVRVDLTGELAADDYDANVIGEVTIQSGYSSGTVTIYTGTDADAENERLLLQAIKDPQSFTPSSDVLPTSGKEKVFMVEDSHTQGYVLTSVPSKIYESGNFTTVSTLHFTPNYVRDDVPVFVTLTASHPAYSALFANDLSTMQLPLGGAGVQAWFQLVPERRNPPTPSACECDGDRENDEVVVTATVGTDITATLGGEVVAETTVHVVDVHKLPEITVTAMTEDGTGPLMELAEGSKYKVKVEANRNQPSGEVTGEDVTVTLALGDDSTAVAEDYRITPSSVKIPGGLNDQSKMFTLDVLAGDGDIGDETLMLDAMVKGKSPNGVVTEEKGTLSVTLMDTTTLNVEPRSDVEVQLAVATARNVADGADDLWTYGDDDLSIKLNALFKLPAEGFTITTDAMSADAKVVTAEADDGVVTVTAMGMGTTTVTVTATTAASAAQISPNIATVEFGIEVDELTLVLMLSGPEDMDMMNLVEGGEGAMVTVTANQKVAMELEVMVMRDRSASTADDMDYELDPMMITIAAGEMMGSTMVMALEDDMPDAGTNDNMPEELVLYGTAEGMEVMGQAKFYIWDMAVPALPIIAQLLLAGLLGIGGFRRYRRR